MSNIEWTGDSWNPIVGCSLASPGCTNCYSMGMAARLHAMRVPQYAGLTKASKAGPVWTGSLAFAEQALLAPLKRKKPQTYFVNSMGDLFHEDCPDDWIDRVFAVMALCPQHTFQALTKRADRMREYCDGLTSGSGAARLMQQIEAMKPSDLWNGNVYQARHELVERSCLPNVWLGVSVEDQRRADERIPALLQTPAAVRWISAEPLLEGITLTHVHHDNVVAINALDGRVGFPVPHAKEANRLDWVVCGGESGHKARPFNEEWMRSLYEQCREAGVPFFAKQMGGAVKSKLPPIPDVLLVREFPLTGDAA